VARCQARTVKGAPCKRPANENSNHCGAHDQRPEAREAFRAAQVKGGKNKNATRAATLVVTINTTTLDGLDAIIAAKMIELARTSPIDPDIFNARCNGFNALCHGARTLLEIQKYKTQKAEISDAVRRIEAHRDQPVAEAELEKLRQLERDHDAELEKRKVLMLPARRASEQMRPEVPGANPDSKADKARGGTPDEQK
jgi:hypothetical protein